VKTFYYKFMGGFVALIAVASLALSLGNFSGCAVLQQHSAAVGLVVSQATMRYIETIPSSQRAERARRIMTIADQVKDVASGKPVTVAQLAQLALSAIPSNLAPSDRALAVSIVSIAAQELQNKIGENVLSADQLVSVTEVVDAIRLAASIYAN
jgi:hypothetical protein